MARRRRLKLAYLLVSLLLLAASLHAPTAYSAAGDPPSGSPAGAVYQLPLEQGRSDAAPKGGGGTAATTTGGEAGASGGGETAGSAGGAGTSESGSLYRTENNFGSSSHVPGVASTGSPTGGSGGPGTAGGGAGAAAGGAAGAAIAGGAVAAETADTGNTSVGAGIVLIAAIALLAVAVGVLSRRFRRRAG